MVVIPEHSEGLTLGLPGVRTDERAARRSLREQIARLERQLGDVLVSAFPHTTVDVRVAGAGGPRVLSLGELERLRDDLAERLQGARAVLDERGAIEESNRVLLEKMLRDPRRYKFVRLPNADLGERGCGVWQVRPRRGLVGMLMGWWEVKLSSGCPLRPRWTRRRGSPRSIRGAWDAVAASARPRARVRQHRRARP